MKKELKCQCNELLGYPEDKTLVVHLMGCPESLEFEEYQNLKWWKKIFRTNPYSYYREHLY